MSASFGKSIVVTLFGESHAKYIGATIDGLPANIEIDHNFITSQLAKRRGKGNLTTSRIENDEYEFISGVKNGKTNGNPLTVLIKNENYNDEEYPLDIARPSHGDYTNYLVNKENGERIGGGYYSGRLTAPIVVLGAIAISVLKNKNITITSKIDDKTIELVKEAKANNDSLGAKVVTVVKNFIPGVGGAFFDTLEGNLASAIFAIPGVKGVSFGLGFDYELSLGSKVNDEFALKDDKIAFTSNNCGGINGGYSNGDDIVINTVFKPTPSIGKMQKCLDLKTKKVIDYQINGRHDACIAIRGQVVVDSVVSLVLIDALKNKYGEEFLK